MSHDHCPPTALNKILQLHRLVLAGTLVTLTAACAPDSVRNVQASGFNAYVNQIASACQPLQIGSQDVGELIRRNEMGDNNYEYFMDVTSRLYYNRIGPEGYRTAVTGFFGAGSSNQRSFDCIIGNLPLDRPKSPQGTY